MWFTGRRYRGKACGLRAEGRKASVYQQKVQRQGEWFRSRKQRGKFLLAAGAEARRVVQESKVEKQIFYQQQVQRQGEWFRSRRQRGKCLLAAGAEVRRVVQESKVEKQMFTSRRYIGKVSGLGAEGRDASVYQQQVQRQGEWFRSRRQRGKCLLAEGTEARRVVQESKVERQMFTSRRYRGKASGLRAEGRKASVYQQKVQRQGESFFRMWVTPCRAICPLALTTVAYFTDNIQVLWKSWGIFFPI